MANENKIWWDVEEIYPARQKMSRIEILEKDEIHCYVIPQGKPKGWSDLPFGSLYSSEIGAGASPWYSIPCIERDPEVGDYVIFIETVGTASDYHGWITKVIEKKSPRLYVVPHLDGNPYSTTLFDYSTNHKRFYVIHPEFVKIMDWKQKQVEVKKPRTPLFQWIGKQ